MLLLMPLICVSSCGSSDIAEGFAKGNPYLGVTRVSSSEGCRMRQVVKVKVELVCDMHFPGWGTKFKKKKKQILCILHRKKKKQNTNFCVLIGQMQKVMRYLRQDQCKKSEIHKCYSALSDTCSPIKSRTPRPVLKCPAETSLWSLTLQKSLAQNRSRQGSVWNASAYLS